MIVWLHLRTVPTDALCAARNLVTARLDRGGQSENDWMNESEARDYLEDLERELLRRLRLRKRGLPG